MTDTPVIHTTAIDTKQRIFAPELDRLARLGTWLAAAETKDPTPEQQGAAAALRLAYAESLELPLLAATELSIIKGRLVVSAQLLRALAEQRGYRTERAESSDNSCTARLWNQGEALGEATFTIEDARRAGLIRDRSAWQTHPARMLWARASANVIKDFAPSVALGLLTEDEAAEITTPAPVRNPDHGPRQRIVIGPDIDPLETDDEPGPDFGPIEDPLLGQLEEEPPQDRITMNQPVGSSFQAPTTRPGVEPPLSQRERRMIWAILTKLKRHDPKLYSEESVRDQLKMQYGVEHVSELSAVQGGELIRKLEHKEQELGL